MYKEIPVSKERYGYIHVLIIYKDIFIHTYFSLLLNIASWHINQCYPRVKCYKQTLPRGLR